MINFHIGAPRIGAELLQTVTAASTQRMLPDTLILPQSIYRDTFRSLVNTRNSIHSKESDWEAAQTFIASLTYYDTIVFSQHALLGTPHDIIASPRGFSRAAARTAALSALFEGHPLTFHLIVTSQVEYITSALGVGARAVIASGTTLSWFDLVAQLKSAAPERPFVVWDFERSRDVALAFVVAMFGTSESAVIEDARQLIRQNRLFEDHNRAHEGLDGLDDPLARLDDQYEVDLRSIGGTEGISLVSSGSVPSNWRL